MLDDRRAPANAIIVQRPALLTEEQQKMLGESERLGWTLKFVRVSRFGPMAVLFATDHDYFVLRADGSVIPEPDIELRH